MAEITTEFELADAQSVRVLETNLLHASDAIYWLDASSAPTVAAMNRIEHPLLITFNNKPRAVKFLHSMGKTAFWQQPTQPMLAGMATEAQRTRTAVAPFQVTGEVADVSGRYNPRLFDVTLGSGAGHAVVLYPSPVAVRVPPAGAVQGSLRVAATQKPLSWAVLSLEVTLSLTETMTFNGQTDANGDFILALTRLPPLPLSTTHYDAVLRVKGDATAHATKWVNPADLVAVELESTTAAGVFAAQIPLAIRPGEIKRIKSFSQSYIAINIV